VQYTKELVASLRVVDLRAPASLRQKDWRGGSSSLQAPINLLSSTLQKLLNAPSGHLGFITLPLSARNDNFSVTLLN
jgi:hypothetical protein